MKSLYLYLEDGAVFEGHSVTNAPERGGLLSFYTGVVGYQEVITDPANLGKIVLFTYPLIGNYGVNSTDAESASPKVSGILAKEYPPYFSSFRAEGNLKDYLEPAGVAFGQGFDTRAILLHIRQHGEMLAVVTSEKSGVEEAKKRASQTTSLGYTPENSPVPCPDAKLQAYVIDIGASRTFYRWLASLGVDASSVQSAEASTDADVIVVSDAPYSAVSDEANIARVRELVGKKPVLGFGHGSAIAALAGSVNRCGGSVTRMPFGDHGVNIPVRFIGGGRNEITVQNHNYMVDVGGDTEAMFTNIHDGTCEGFVYRNARVAGANFLPNQTWFDAMLASVGVN